jgi:hypothetical protein
MRWPTTDPIPLKATARNPDRPTLGWQVNRAARALDPRHRPLMPHQRLIADVSQEIDADGLRHYRVVIVELPRQTGKSTTVDAVLVTNTARRPDVTSLYTAQNRLMARRRIIDDLEPKRLRRSPATRGRYRAVRSNGSEAIHWHNGSSILIAANTDDAGHGLTLNGDAVIDEAFAHRDLTMVAALSPTQITCPDPQLWIVSTPGDGTDGLLQHYEEVGDASLFDPDSRVAFFVWGRADDEDPTDEAVWWRRIPALGTPEQYAAGERTITVDVLRQQLATLGVAEFDRAHLCHRRTEQYASVIDPAVWAAQLAPDLAPVAPFVLAADIAHDRSAASIAAVGRNTAGGLSVVTIRKPGTSWLLAELRQLQAARRPAAIAADRRAPIGSMIERLELDLGPILQPDTIEFSQSAGDLVDALGDGLLSHAGQHELDVAVAVARTRPLGDLWAWNRRDSPEDISPLCAATMALWAHRKMFPTGRRGTIHQ